MIKLLLPLLIACLTLSNLFGQIHISKVLKSDKDLGDELTFETMDNINKDMIQTTEAIKTFNTSALLKYASPQLKQDGKSIQEVFDRCTAHFSKSSKNEFYLEDFDANYSRYNYSGYAKFWSKNEEVGDLLIRFEYFKTDKTYTIEQISFFSDQMDLELGFPESRFLIVNKLQQLSQLNQNDPLLLSGKYEEVLQHIESFENQSGVLFEKSDEVISQLYGSAAWYKCLVNAPMDAIEYAKKGIKRHKENKWIFSNLALGHLLNGDDKIASNLYKDLMFTKFDGRQSFKDVFLEDLSEIERIGFLPESAADIRKLLQESTLPERKDGMEDYNKLNKKYPKHSSVKQALENPLEVEKIVISSNKDLAELSQLKACINLKVLYLVNCGFATIPDFVYEFKELEILNLSDNNIKAIDDKISTVRKLIELDLSNNKIESISANIGDLKDLLSLKLQKNNLTELPNSWGELDKLFKFDLSQNLLTILPSSMGGMRNLTHLVFSQNQISQLPPSLSSCKNLKTITATNNKIDILPKTMDSMENLTELYLDNNKLTGIPASIGNMPQLSILSAANNQIEKLPNELFEKWGGYRLALNNNQINEIPESIDKSDWINIDFEENQIKELPSSISFLTGIQSLNLGFNELDNVDDLQSCYQLRSLKLYGNNISSLPKDLTNWLSLMALNVNSNNLTELPIELKENKSLFKLEIGDNPNLAIPDWISGFTKLTFLAVDKNYDADFISDLQKQMPNCRITTY